MRHRGGADLALLRALLEVSHRYIHPHIAVEVEKHGVPTGDSVEKLSNTVMGFNLRCETVLAKPKGLDHLAGKLFPIDRGIRGKMRVEVSDSTIHLCRHYETVNLRRLTLKASRNDCELLADSRGRSGLAVRVG